MATIMLEEAQTHLKELIEQLQPGEEVTLTRDDKPVATLKAVPASRLLPQLGTLKGTVLSMEHFDDPLEEFEEYR
jgi:antitoxin (DNA-binding transcriptional repressor) of toxin-antitoxin stability system